MSDSPQEKAHSQWSDLGARLAGWFRQDGPSKRDEEGKPAGSTGQRFASYLALLAVVALGIWASRMGVTSLPEAFSNPIAQASRPDPTPVPDESLKMEDLPPYGAGGPLIDGIVRQADVHTIIPTRARVTIIKYMVQPGDTLFGIAEKYNLKPETILWGNWETLAGDPHSLRPGQELSILPVNGALHVWSAGEGLNGVAEFYGVDAEEVVEWPGNGLDPTIDVVSPGIEAGTALVIPGGKRELPSWRSPRIRRDNPASASVLGEGHCGSVYDGPIGTGVFAWPSNSGYISGYNFNPDLHPGIDIGGKEGYPIYASDAGVVVYAGWNDWGYGLMIVIDHGNGWQTLYAHLSQYNVVCGQAVYQGNVIGLMGTTGNSSGPHLHFEMMSDQWGKVNPFNFLP